MEKGDDPPCYGEIATLFMVNFEKKTKSKTDFFAMEKASFPPFSKDPVGKRRLALIIYRSFFRGGAHHPFSNGSVLEKGRQAPGKIHG